MCTHLKSIWKFCAFTPMYFCVLYLQPRPAAKCIWGCPIGRGAGELNCWVHTIKGHPAVCLEINFIPRQFRQCCRGPEECQRSQNDRIQYWAALVLAVAAGVNIEARKIDSYSNALLLVASGGLAYTGWFRGSTNKFGRVSNVTRHVATHGELRPKCRCSTFAGA